MAVPTRWAPWIEEVAGDGTITLTGLGWATVGSVTAASVSLTPHIKTRAFVHFQVDCECTVFAASPIFRCRINLAGAGLLPDGLFRPAAAGERQSISNSVVFDLAKETTVTIKLEAESSAAGSTFVVRRGSFRIVALPKLHA